MTEMAWVAAALPEDALLDLLDDEIDPFHLFAQIRPMLQLHAGVVTAIGKIGEHVGHLANDRAAAHVIEIDQEKHHHANAQHDQGINKHALFEHRERRDARTGHAQSGAV